MDDAAPNADWPFLATAPPGRIDLQRQLVDSDPFFRRLGVHLHEADADRVTLALAFRPDLVQPTGILHGGLHCILIDSAIAQALLTTIRPAFSVVTVHLDTKYFAPVMRGQIFASAHVVRKGKRIAHGEAIVRDDAGTLVAQGWGVFAVTGGSMSRS
jgi:uncharacterized protein (TIGR00369 family)